MGCSQEGKPAMETHCAYFHPTVKPFQSLLSHCSCDIYSGDHCIPACSHLHTWFNFDRSTRLPVLAAPTYSSRAEPCNDSHILNCILLLPYLLSSAPGLGGMLLLFIPLTLSTERLLSRDNAIFFFSTTNSKNSLIFTDY